MDTVVLFTEFPEIQKSYDLMEEFCGFYRIFAGDTNSKFLAKTALEKWYKNVENSKISGMQNFAHTVKSHEFHFRIKKYFTPD